MWSRSKVFSPRRRIELVQRTAEDRNFLRRERLCKADQCRIRIMTGRQRFVHEHSGMSTRSAHGGESDESAVEPPAYQALPNQTVQNGGHSCVGVFRKHIGDIAASELAVVLIPKDVHDPSLELTELGRTTGTRRAAARIARAHRIFACRGFSHLSSSDNQAERFLIRHIAENRQVEFRHVSDV